MDSLVKRSLLDKYDLVDDTTDGSKLFKKARYCNTSPARAKELFGIDVDKLIDNREYFIDILDPKPVSYEIKKEVYRIILRNLKSFGRYVDKLNESEREDIVNEILKTLVLEILEERKIPIGRLKLSKQESLVDLEGQIYRVDAVVGLSDENNLKTYILLFEYKNDFNKYKGLVQLCLELKDVYSKNNDSKSIYGILTDAIDYAVVLFDGKEYKVSEVVRGCFKGFDKHKQVWIDKYTDFLSMINGALNSAIDSRIR